MDRTMIAPWKAEEKELSEKLYKKLQGLMLLFPPTDQMSKSMSEEMFLKPNQQAFFHTMHYLFRLLDPVEFKKRFYWPITDKRGEANFRTSTVEYLKYLNEKHQLQWTNIKSYLVVMPGGMKFINFLLDFVGFVVQELTRQREKHLLADIEPGLVTDVILKRMQHQNSFFKAYSSEYIKELDLQNAKLCEKTSLVRQQLEAMALKMGLNVAQITSDKLLEEFEAANYKLYQQNFSARINNIVTLEKPLFDLKEVIEKFQTTESVVKYDKDVVRQSLRKIHEQFPLETGHNDGVAAQLSFVKPNNGDGITMDSLITAFNSIHATVVDALEVSDQKSSCSKFVCTELESLKGELQQLETQITDFQKMLNAQNLKKRLQERQHYSHTPIRGTSTQSSCVQRSNENALMMKFICTPPIKLEMLENMRTTRLPLHDDFSSKTMDSFNNFLAVPRSTRKPKQNQQPEHHSLDLSNTIKSRIIDPMQLLRTINKDTSKVTHIPQINLSMLGAKWKERRCLFGGETDSTRPPTPKKTAAAETANISEQLLGAPSNTINSTLVQSPFTPFNSNDHTRITRSQLLDTSGGGAAGGSLMYAKKLSAVKKVQDASLNLNNLSTSPSGRLEPLVTAIKETPKLQLNDETLNDSLNAAADVLKSHLNAPGHSPLIEQTEDTDENNPNVANIQPEFMLNISLHGDADSLFNISDVTKDITM